MWKYSKADLYRYTGKTDFKTFLKTWRSCPEYRTISYFRAAQHYPGRTFMGYFFRYLLKKCYYKFHINLFPESTVGEGLFVGHFSNVGISPFATVGKNFNIGQGANIGQANRGRLKGAPTIGDCVWVGPNAIVVGNIKIGNNVLIAPGAFVNFDVPDNSMVIGNPGVIKPSLNATEGYIKNKVEEITS